MYTIWLPMSGLPHFVITVVGPTAHRQHAMLTHFLYTDVVAQQFVTANVFYLSVVRLS